MNREIGSEFEYVERTDGHVNLALRPLGEDYRLLFSGRTAIEHVLADANAKGKALLPSYCCKSMIEPFWARGLTVEYYSVDFDGRMRVHCDVSDDCSVLLWCNYFGFRGPTFPEDAARRIHAHGGIIVEDITHSLLSAKPMHEGSDYAVASIRKWFPVLSGGLSVKARGRFQSAPEHAPEPEFVRMRLQAMRAKQAYIDACYKGDKQAFLQLYAEANKWLRDHYSGRCIDEQSLAILRATDMDSVRMKRIENSRVLYSALQGVPGLRFLFAQEQTDCPLFVPVVMEPAVRERAKRDLIDAGIFCPVHWPQPGEMCQSNLYDTELSLVCDQRYSEDDMNRCAAALIESCRSAAGRCGGKNRHKEAETY